MSTAALAIIVHWCFADVKRIAADLRQLFTVISNQPVRCADRRQVQPLLGDFVPNSQVEHLDRQAHRIMRWLSGQRSQFSLACFSCNERNGRIQKIVSLHVLPQGLGKNIFLGTCPTLPFLLRRTIRNHLRRSRPEKILNVFQRIHLRFFRACGLASGRTSFASLRTAMSDRLLER